MTLRPFILVAVTASIVGCASQPATVRQPATSLLVGTTSPTARVLLKSVDNGPTLWAAPGVLTTKATITPGVHKIEVMCESQGSLHFVTGELTLDVQPGHTYDLMGSLAPGAERCSVSATIRS
jgi:hypothetical protein